MDREGHSVLGPRQVVVLGGIEIPPAIGRRLCSVIAPHKEGQPVPPATTGQARCNTAFEKSTR